MSDLAAQAWMVVGAKSYKSLHLDFVSATQGAVKNHGIIKPLVLEESVHELIAAAYRAGLENAKEK